jgi:2-polyprenyl-3-methyl-5-hydroxy-6-metoxy-1,4-benzoquinol methylase
MKENDNELTSQLESQHSANSRNIDESQLSVLRALTPYPDCLDELVERARSTIGFFTKHATRSIEYPWVVNILERYNVKNVLDIGAGVSVLPIRFADSGMSVVTVDYSKMIRTQETLGNWTEWGFLDYSMFNSSIRSFNTELAKVQVADSFDACYSVSVLEHMPKAARQSMIKSAAQKVRLGGLMALTLDLVPKTFNLWNRDRGKIVEDPILHGDLHAFLDDAHQVGWMLEHLEIVRAIPDSVTDIAMLILKKT